MLALFKAELKRYALVALIAMMVISTLLAFYNGEYPLLENARNFGYYSMFIPVLFALTFGVVQMVLTKRKSHWAYLMHRPLSSQRIHGAIFGAGALMLMFVLILPLTCVIVAYDIGTNEVVELRHYLFILHVVMVTLSSYFLGGYVTLNPNRGAILSFALLTVMFTSTPIPASLSLISDVLITFTMYYLCARSFKVNLPQHFTSKRDIVLAALVIHCAVLFVVNIAQLLHYELPLFFIDEHPSGYSTAELVAKNDFSALRNMDTAGQIEHIMGPDDSADKQMLLQQAGQLELDYIWVNVRAVPIMQRGQLMNMGRFHGMDDAFNNAYWSFSHKRMVLVGKYKNSGENAGYLGPNGFVQPNTELRENDRFKVVPTYERDQFIVADDKLYLVDFEAKQLTLKYQLPKGERFVNRVHFDPKGNIAAVRSEKSLYLFDLDELMAHNTSVVANVVVPHPRQIRQQRSLGYYVLPDGYLIEYYDSSYFGFNRTGISLVLAKYDGTSSVLAEKEFANWGAQPPLIKHERVWVSPIISAIVFSHMQSYFYPHQPDQYLTTENYAERIFPTSVYIMSVIMAIFSALTTWWLSRRLNMKPATARLWIVMNLIMGFSGLLTFFLMNRWRGLIFVGKQK
jgi:hypothetical protein